jgi:enediyne biosynthesis protein E4
MEDVWTTSHIRKSVARSQLHMESTQAALLVAGTFASSLLALTALQENVPVPQFADVTERSKITFFNHASHTSRKYLPETMVGGVAMVDYDKDGLTDLFFVNGAELKDPMLRLTVPDKTGPKYWNRLYRNNGDGTFTDVTASAGVKGEGFGMGVAAADYDNDGFPDLYVTAVGHNVLYHNNGDGTFTDVTKRAGVEGGGWSAGAMFVDYDRDGLLDLFVSRYLKWDFSKDVFCGQPKPGFRAYCHPDQFPPVSHLLYHNEGHGHFRDTSDESGIEKSPGKGLGVAFNDYDRDGWPDILVANDSLPQQLFHNLKNGKFEEVGTTVGIAYDEDGNAFSGMGLDFADLDNDGWPDVFVNALARQKYALFRNRSGNFEYVSGPTGLSAASVSHSGWGAKFVDYDNDGLKDIFVAQGHVMDNIELTQPDVRYVEPPLLLQNVPPAFVDVSKVSGPVFGRRVAARGAAFGYLANDGLLSIAVNCNEQPAILLETTRSSNHWLIVDVVGTRSNRDGIGAQLVLRTADGKQQYGLVSGAGSYLSANDKRVHFGLGNMSIAKLLEIYWPSGLTQVLTNIRADQILVVRESPQ